MFMKPEIHRGEFVIGEDNNGGYFAIPVQAIGQGSRITLSVLKKFGLDTTEFEIVYGYGARLNAPGYIDCTEWIVCDTLDEARRELIDTWADGMDDAYYNEFVEILDECQE